MIFALALMAVFAPATVEADEEPSIEGMLQAMDRSDVPDATSALPEATTSPVNVEVQWRLWNRTVVEGRPGLDELDTLRYDASSIGVPSLPHHQLAVLHRAQRGEEYGLSHDEIRRLKRAAHSLAPHLPYAQFELARWEVETSLSTSYRAISPYMNGVSTAYGWLDLRIGWALKWAMILFMAASIAFIGFVLAQLLRYFGIAAYDGTRVLPRGFSSTQTVILLVAIVLVPGLLMQSPLLSMILLLALVIPFQQINERIVSICFFALIAALPFADDNLGQFLTYPGSDAQNLLHAHYHGCDEACHDWLESLAEDDEYGVARFVERTAAFRTASHEQMLELHDWFGEHEPERDSDLAANWLNLEGGVAIAVGESEEALDPLEEATRADPMAAAPWFNQMRAYQILDEEGPSQQALEAAFNRDLNATSQRLDYTRRDAHSFLMLDLVDSDLIWRHHAPKADDAPSLLSPFWTLAAGERLELRWAPWIGFVGILLVLLTLPLYLRRTISAPCPKCGLARDPQEAEQTGDHHYCFPCYQTFVSGSALEYHARIHSEATLGRRDRLQSFLRRAFSLITPGVGHILGGHAIRGILAFLALTTGALLLLYPLGPFGAWRGAFELFREHWAGQGLLAWILISIGASVGLTGLIRGVESTRVRPKSKTKDKGGAR